MNAEIIILLALMQLMLVVIAVLARWGCKASDKARLLERDARYWFDECQRLRQDRKPPVKDDGDWWKD